MKHIKLVLVGYIRLSLRNINRIEYRPQEKTQIILGSNGSGKSSLMKELSPLPAVSSQFRKGGSKEIWIEHKGDIYYLVSRFTEDGDHYEFYLNDQNLNPGRTITVYKELVKEHFNYTQELHNLLTGQTLFYDLSTNDRRKWFMQLSDKDYTYAFKYFQKLKEKHRDIQGAIKQCQTRLSEEISKQISKEEEAVLREEIQKLYEDLNLLVNSKVQDTRPLHLRDNQHNQAIDVEIYRSIDKLYSLLASEDIIHKHLSDVQLEESIAKLKTERSVLDQEIKVRLDTILKFQDQFSDIASLDGYKLEDVVKEITQTEEDIKKLEPLLNKNYIVEEGSAQTALEGLVSLYDNLSHLTEALSQVKNRNATQSDYRSLSTLIEDENQVLLKIHAKLEPISFKLKELEKLKQSDKAECPKCKHTWIPKYNKIEHEQLQAQFNITHTHYEEKKKLHNENKEKLADIVNFFSLMTNFSRMISSFTTLSVFWEYITRNQLIELNPLAIMTEVELLRSSLTVQSQIDSLLKALKEKERLKKMLEKVNEKDRVKQKQYLEEENQKVALLQLKKREVHSEIGLLEADLSLRKAIARKNEELLLNLDNRKKEYSEKMKFLAMNLIDEFISSLKLSISQKERALSQIDIRKSLISSIETELAQLKLDQEAIGYAVESLSPTTGLIAKGLTDFINEFIRRCNVFINRVWTYPLELKKIEPSEEDGVDLDYKFGVSVNHNDTSPDISKTSSGMKEIIHLACVIVSMEFLGLENYPVFLDEFAVKMDEAHRQAAYNVIEYLIDSTNFSQVFVISHWQSGYSSLSNADISVLCQSNVTIPDHLQFNTCCDIS